MPGRSILYVIPFFPSSVKVASTPPVGGAELQAHRVARLLAPEFCIWVLASLMPGQPQEEVADGVTVVRVPLSARGGKWGALAVLVRLLLAGFRLSRADLVQGFQLNALTLAAAAVAVLRRSPFVIKITGRGNFERLTSGRGRLQLRLLHSVASALVVPSRSCAQAALTAGVPPAKIHLIPNGVDTIHFHPPPPAERVRSRAEMSYAPGDFVLCWIGRLDWLKGLDCVFPAWALVQERCSQARLLIVGEGAEEAVARELAETYPGSIRRLPFQADVRPIYARADAVLVTSRSEGLSNVLLEGLASGLVAVVSAVPENTEVGGGQDFLLAFDRASPHSLADAVAAAIERQRRRVELGHAARRHVEENYSLSSTAARWSGLYRTLLERGRDLEAPPSASAAEPLPQQKG